MRDACASTKSAMVELPAPASSVNDGNRQLPMFHFGAGIRTRRRGTARNFCDQKIFSDSQ